MKECICIICHKPNFVYFDFLNTITSYDVVVIIDDETEDYYKNNKEFYDSKYPNIMISQFNFNHCIEDGFQLSNFTLNKIVSGWDKAMYYYYLLYNKKLKIKNNYNCVWFIEEDAFFYDENVLKNIDTKYPNSDFLSNKMILRNNDSWLWFAVRSYLKCEQYSAMVCACRMSKRMLTCIFDYVSKYKELFFLEVMFPTIARANNLICDSPDELSCISFDNKWSLKEINKTHLFHPIKNMELHPLLREAL
jgi:hypothetical protein